MPVIFKHQRASPKFRETSSSVGSQQQRPGSAAGGSRPYLGVIEGAPSHGRRLRQRGSIFLHRGSMRARHSIIRLKDKSSSIHKYIQNPRLLLKLAKDFYHKRHLKHLIPLFFVLLYMLLGAALFYWVEAAAERERLGRIESEYASERMMFVKRVEEIIIDTASPPNTTKRREFVEEAVDHLRTQLGHGPPPPEPEWTFLTSMYFAGTIFTTIGYGDIACVTLLGQIATVAYAIFGIPLMLITLNELGKFLYKTINEFMAALKEWCKKLGKKCKCMAGKEKEQQKAKSKGNKPQMAERDAEKEEARPVRPDTNHVQQQKRPKSPVVEDNKAVSFNINAPDDELSLHMEVVDTDPESLQPATDRPTILHKENSVASSIQRSGDHLGIVMEEEGSEAESDAEYAEERAEGTDRPSGVATVQAPRMHVMVAIVTTFAWIFGCAALFRLWEKNWSYWDSLYFMFISLLTIGLGDVNVQRRDLMVLCFIFVIIGLSLVSMCINVIQASLEDLYRRMLMKILADYQASLNQDGSHKNASIGVMKSLGESKAAKFLMPLMSENTKRAVFEQVQEEAKESGMEIPPIFDHFDTLNELIHAEVAKDEETQAAIIDDILLKPEVSATEAGTQLGRTSTFADFNNLRENHTQTDIVPRDDKNDQTPRVEMDDMAVQVELMPEPQVPHTAETEQQTDAKRESDAGMQTAAVSRRDAESMTSARMGQIGTSRDTQTERVLCLDEEVQTFARVGAFDGVTQTDEKPMKNQRIQTPHPVRQDAEAQTDEINPELEKIHGSRIREARRRIRRAFASPHSRNKGDQEPTMSGWQEYSSDESVDWDPYDGLHAERQKPVSHLKEMFEKRGSADQQRPSTSGSIRWKEGRGSLRTHNEEQPQQPQ